MYLILQLTQRSATVSCLHNSSTHRTNVLMMTHVSHTRTYSIYISWNIISSFAIHRDGKLVVTCRRGITDPRGFKSRNEVPYADELSTLRRHLTGDPEMCVSLVHASYLPNRASVCLRSKLSLAWCSTRYTLFRGWKTGLEASSPCQPFGKNTYGQDLG